MPPQELPSETTRVRAILRGIQLMVILTYVCPSPYRERFLHLKIRLNTRRKEHERSAGFGVQSGLSIKEMESSQPLSKHPKAFDAVFFMATNKEGFYFVAGSERRQHGIINGLCYLLVPNIGLLCSPKLPDTILFGAKNNEFGAEGLLIKPIEPMKKWKITYQGKILSTDSSKIFDVQIDGDWFSKLPYFNFDTDLHPSALANAIARETWTKDYFNNLKEAHQTHYEQMGSMKATITVQNQTHDIQMQAFRDHSYGKKRDWDLMHRYAFHMMFLEDGTMATVGVICQPCTGSVLQTGYAYTPEGKVYPLEWCTLNLYEHGESGTPPTDHGFQFKAGPTTYTVEVLVQCKNVHYVGWKWEARMVERFVKYKVNGIPGRGVSEFHYYNPDGRPQKYAANDPQWFQAITY
ncbi:Uncharacterized protein GBIM_21068 [Gryllus bimaculatus]|nr:Uncharacterized protein GBIM_21068 [Gryllus bimaculatus]